MDNINNFRLSRIGYSIVIALYILIKFAYFFTLICVLGGYKIFADNNMFSTLKRNLIFISLVLLILIADITLELTLNKLLIVKNSVALVLYLGVMFLLIRKTMYGISVSLIYIKIYFYKIEFRILLIISSKYQRNLFVK